MLASDMQKATSDLMAQPFVELSFGVVGETLPADHGYGLYSAIAPISLRDTLTMPLIPLGVEHRTAPFWRAAHTFDAARRYKSISRKSYGLTVSEFFI